MDVRRCGKCLIWRDSSGLLWWEKAEEVLHEEEGGARVWRKWSVVVDEPSEDGKVVGKRAWNEERGIWEVRRDDLVE